jgi:tetratricopeptide (TPR) repeat protein
VGALDAVVSRHPWLDEALRARALAQRDWPDPPPGSERARLMRAERDLRRALRLRPRWGEAWADLGLVLHRRGEHEEARRALARAADLDPTHLGIGTARAAVLARTAGARAALGELSRLRAVNPAWPSAHAREAARRLTGDPALLRAAGFEP